MASAARAELLDALGKGLRLPEHFGDNWDALADCLEDSDWLGGHGMAIVLRHAGTYRKTYRTDWQTLAEILGEASGILAGAAQAVLGLLSPELQDSGLGAGARAYAGIARAPARARGFPGYWQSVTGSREVGETLAETATRELREETGLDAAAFGGVVDWKRTNEYEIFPRWRHRYPPGTTHNTEHVFSLQVPQPVSVRLAPRRAPLSPVAAVGGGCAEVLFLVEPAGDRGTAAPSSGRKERTMKPHRHACCRARLRGCAVRRRRLRLAQPSVTVAASATATITNRPAARRGCAPRRRTRARARRRAR